MKKLIIVWVGVFCAAAQGFAGTLAGWDVHSQAGGANNFGPSPLAAAVSAANLNVGGLTRGPGVSTTGTGAARGWGGVNWQAASEAAAISANQFVTCTVTANAGYAVSFASVSKFSYRRSGTGAASGELQYQIGVGAFTDVASLNYSSTSSSGADIAVPIDLSGIAALQNVAAGTTVTFRIVNWGGTSSSGTWYIFDTANTTADDFEIQGAVTAAAPPATQVRVETAADGSGTLVSAQTLTTGSSLTAYAVSRDAGNNFVANVAGTWALVNVTGGVAAGDLVPSADGKSATFHANNAGTAVIHVVSGTLNSTDSGTITVMGLPTPPTGLGALSLAAAPIGSNVTFTVTVTPGANPVSSGVTVTANLSSIGGPTGQAFYDDGTHGDAVAGDNVFSFSYLIPANSTLGAVSLPVTIQDSQGRSSAASISMSVLGNLTIIHANDTHARVTPHQWVIPQHSSDPATEFETAGGAAYLGGKTIQLATQTPDALVLDGGDVSEGNPVGDWNGPGSPVDTFGNGTIVQYFVTLDAKLRAIPGRAGRGLDAMVVGNHDIRDISYLNNLKNQTAFPVISINVCAAGTHTPYFQPYVILNINGNKIGVIGYTTETSDSPESAVNSLISVVHCDWSSTDSTKIHFADYVNQLRNTLGCNLVILLTHDGHADLCTSSGGSTPILVDSPAAKLPEVAITGHWHTACDTVWQPEILNYKTIFTEEGSYIHYVGELQVNGLGRFLANTNIPIRDADITPDSDIASQIQTRKDQWNAVTPNYTLDQVVGYSADDLLLDNKMKWWSSDEYPWSGNNTAGNWICDGVEWKALQLFGQCDVSMESGGGVRSDIPAGPATYTQIYESYPWADDLIYRVNMTGQEIWNYIQAHGCDVGISSGWVITAHDGALTSITINGSPIDLSHTYTVAINNYMYLHDTVPFSDPSPVTSTALARDALVAYTATFTQDNPYHAGVDRYNLNTEFSGGYRAVVTMMNDADTETVFDDGFIRFLSANAETLGHLGTKQVPTSLVNSDGSIVKSNRLAEIELYRSYLGFRTNVLHPGDIIETWGKGSFYGGDPEFVDQEGIYADGVEFKIVGHDPSLAQPAFVSDISTALDDWHKNHYLQFLARKTGPSSVVDQQGTVLSVMDVTAFSAKSLPGNVGDLLLLTGVPTSEYFSMRFRCGSAALASAAGFTGYPPTSSVDPVAAYVQTASTLHLTAHAAVEGATKSTLTPIADSEVDHNEPNATNGTSTSMYIESSSGGTYGDERAWTKFDLSTLSLPAGAVVTNVQLKLYCWSASAVSNLPVEVRSASDDSWFESGVGSITWNNQPALGQVLDTQTLALGVANLYYGWNVTSFALGELAGDKVASFVAKAVTEGDATAVSYGFDAKEYSSGADAPLLEFDYAPVTANGTGVAQIQYQYRFSTDNLNWTAWSTFAIDTTAPYAADFSYPNGYGYYQFASIATGADNNVEPAHYLADTSVLYTNHPPIAADYAMACWRNLSNTLAVAKLLRASSDPDGDSFNVVSVSTPSLNGAAVTLAGGTILFVPALNVAGPDSFTYTLQDVHGASSQGTVSVNVMVPAGSGPSVLHVVRNGGTATVSFAGVPGQLYNVEASSDLITWHVIGSATAGANGLYQFDDTDAGSYPQRYYRSRLP